MINQKVYSEGIEIKWLKITKRRLEGLPLIIGVYKHYKGGIYYVLGFGIHTETGEKMVIYTDQKGKTWIRPFEMFTSAVVHEGVKVQRFTYIGTEERN